MMNKLEDQALALAGMFQSAALIEQMASTGELNQAAFDCCVDSLFAFEAESTVDVFGDLSGLTRGLQTMSQYLGGQNQTSGKNVVYYLMSMHKISRKLLRNQSMASQLQNDLRTIQQHVIDYDMSRLSLIKKIDGLYQDTISNTQPRIIIRGEQNYLRNNDNAGKIRALLLSGIRSAVLWHQLGGSKWKLVLSRKKYVSTATKLLSRL